MPKYIVRVGIKLDGFADVCVEAKDKKAALKAAEEYVRDSGGADWEVDEDSFGDLTDLNAFHCEKAEE